MKRPGGLLITAVVACFCGVHLSAQKPAADLKPILDRAADYVAAYEDHELGNVIASEDYVQDLSTYLTSGLTMHRTQRRTESDFMIVLVGDDRIGVRKVNRLDGKPVKSSTGNLETLMDDSPEGIRNQFRELNRESSQYNLVPVFGQINLPTAALRVVRRKEAPRFSFTRSGTSRINGVQTIEVAFKELMSPTLVHGEHGESLLSWGNLWIEPGTGRILKTDFNVENPVVMTKGRIIVTYSQDKTLGILVPEEQKEHYQAKLGIVDAVAKYSKFRSFNVDVKSDIVKQ